MDDGYLIIRERRWEIRIGGGWGVTRPYQKNNGYNLWKILHNRDWTRLWSQIDWLFEEMDRIWAI